MKNAPVTMQKHHTAPFGAVWDCIGLFSINFFLDTGKLRWDINRLRTFIAADPTANTGICPVPCRNFFVFFADLRHCMMAGAVIIRGKYGRDIYPCGAFHTIAAAGAGDGGDGIEFTDCIVNYHSFFFGQGRQSIK